MPTQQAIDKLKADWSGDPCWDLEDTDGFEEHREELLAFRQEQEALWDAQRQDDYRILAQRYGCPPNPVIGERLSALEYRQARETDQAHRLLCHYLRVTDPDGRAELRCLVDCLVEAAHAKTLHYLHLLIEKHQLSHPEA